VSDSFRAQIEALLAATDRASTKKARGDVLEQLAALILGSVPGVEVGATNVMDVHRSEELDLMLLNRKRPDGLDLFPPFILTECKNWKKRLNAQGVAAFARKLENRGLNVGLLLSRRGITGDARTLTAAQQVLSDELGRGREIVVITEADLVQINEPADVAQLLLVRRTSLMTTRGFVQDDDWLNGSGTSEAAEPDAPRPRREGRMGWNDVSLAIRQEEEKVCAGMLRRVPTLPDDEGEAVQILVDRTNALHESIDEAVRHDHDPGRWQSVLEAMLDLGAIAIAFFHRGGGWESEPRELVASTIPYMPNVRYVSWDSRLFRDLVTYYSLEVSNEEDLDARTATLSLLGMMVDSHWRLEDSLYEWQASEAE
jgi:hypothetical protein